MKSFAFPFYCNPHTYQIEVIFFLFLQHVLPTFIKYKMQTGVWDKSLLVYIRMLIIIHISSRFYNQNIFRVAFCVLHNWVEIALDPYLCLETPKSTWGVYEIYEWCTLHTFLINAQATTKQRALNINFKALLLSSPFLFHHYIRLALSPHHLQCLRAILFAKLLAYQKSTPLLSCNALVKC